MRRRIILLAAVAVSVSAVLVLTACTSSEKAGQTSGGQNAEGTQNDTQNTGSGTQEAADSTPGSSSSDSSSGLENTSAAQPDQSADEPVGDVIPDEDADAAENDVSGAEDVDSWSGTYTTDTETLTVNLIDAETISFSFAQSGISGTAQVSGTQAVYKGDDHHDVVFNLNGTVLNVAVSSEEDFDASGSPLNGSFIRTAN